MVTPPSTGFCTTSNTTQPPVLTVIIVCYLEHIQPALLYQEESHPTVIPPGRVEHMGYVR